MLCGNGPIKVYILKYISIYLNVRFSCKTESRFEFFVKNESMHKKNKTTFSAMADSEN